MLNLTLDEEANPWPSLLSCLNLEQDENLTLFEPSLLSVEPMTNNQPISSTPSSPNVEPDPSPKPSLLERFSTASMNNIPFLLKPENRHSPLTSPKSIPSHPPTQLTLLERIQEIPSSLPLAKRMNISIDESPRPFKKIRQSIDSSEDCSNAQQPLTSSETMILQSEQNELDTPSPICLGMMPSPNGKTPNTRSVARGLANCSNFLEKTYHDQNSSSGRLEIPLLGSKWHNGSEYSEVRQLISTTSSLQSAALLSMKKGRLALEQRLCHSALMNRKGRSSQRVIGEQHGDGHQKPLPLPFLTEPMSSVSMPSTSRASSMPNIQLHTSESLCMTSPSETLFVEDKQPFLPNVTSFPTCIPQSCPPMESNSPPTQYSKGGLEGPKHLSLLEWKPATSLTQPMVALTAPADTATTANLAERMGMGSLAASK